jgi:hypothetical protein
MQLILRLFRPVPDLRIDEVMPRFQQTAGNESIKVHDMLAGFSAIPLRPLLFEAAKVLQQGHMHTPPPPHFSRFEVEKVLQ